MCSLTCTICHCFDRVTTKVTQAGRSVVSFLPCLLPLFIPWLFTESLVCLRQLGTRDVAVSKTENPVLWELAVECIHILQDGVRSGLPWYTWDKMEHHRLIYSRTWREGIHGQGGWGPWTCAKGSDLFHAGHGWGHWSYMTTHLSSASPAPAHPSDVKLHVTFSGELPPCPQGCVRCPC